VKAAGRLSKAEIIDCVPCSNRDARLILSKDLVVSKIATFYLCQEADRESGHGDFHRKKARIENIRFDHDHRRDRCCVGRGQAGACDRRIRVDASGATHLDALKERLAQAPRRRDFKAVPMILNHPEQWDHEALNEVLAYKPVPKQVWDNTNIDGPWLSMMRNALNSQIWSFKTSGLSGCFDDPWRGNPCNL
jgi:hypothetical protein